MTMTMTKRKMKVMSFERGFPKVVAKCVLDAPKNDRRIHPLESSTNRLSDSKSEPNAEIAVQQRVEVGLDIKSEITRVESRERIEPLEVIVAIVPKNSVSATSHIQPIAVEAGRKVR